MLSLFRGACISAELLQSKHLFNGQADAELILLNDNIVHDFGQSSSSDLKVRARTHSIRFCVNEPEMNGLSTLRVINILICMSGSMV